MEHALNANASAMIVVFIIGYLLIIFEHVIRINKATSALLMAVGLWSLEFADSAYADVNMIRFSEHLANISQVIFFLLGAITIVEIIHAHGGFAMVANAIRIPSKKACLWVVGFLAFSLSSVLDNLTTTIVLVVMLKKFLDIRSDKLIFGAVVVIAANAGGAFSPIGDVTTTMLWIGGQVSTVPLLSNLFIPSLVCFLVSTFCLSFSITGKMKKRVVDKKDILEPRGELVFVCGILSLISVPIFKILTGLPPFMGILLAMSFMWLLTDILHRNYEDRDHLRVPSIIPKLDFSTIFFFLGILLGVSALETGGILHEFSAWLDTAISSEYMVATFIGFASAVIDNVPLVAATMGMYDIAVFQKDHPFWLLIAFCAGTGGSMLIIGSAAGVAFMGLEKVNFFWYIKKASLPAMIGYLAGIAAYWFWVNGG